MWWTNDKISQWGALKILPHGNHIFLITINTHGLRKVRFPLPEATVSLIILQNKQALPKKQDFSNNFKTNCHRNMYMVYMRVHLG